MKKYFAFFIVGFGLLLAARADAQPISRLSAEFLNFDGTETASNTQACPTLSSCTTPALMVAGTGGKLVYRKTVFVPYASGPETLYVTLSAIGDDRGGDYSNFISCNVDAPGGSPSLPSQVCNPTATSTGADKAPPGWLTMAHHFAYFVRDYVSDGTRVFTTSEFSGGDGGGGTGDEHDNDYYYTWCKAISPGVHTINLRMGNFSGPSNRLTNQTFVFFEKAFVYIDVSDTPPFGACTKASPPNPG